MPVIINEIKVTVTVDENLPAGSHTTDQAAKNSLTDESLITEIVNEILKSKKER